MSTMVVVVARVLSLCAAWCSTASVASAESRMAASEYMGTYEQYRHLAMPYTHVVQDEETQQLRFATPEEGRKLAAKAAHAETTERKATEQSGKTGGEEQHESFLQMQTKLTLFPVKMNLDIRAQQPTAVTMNWDGGEAKLRLDAAFDGGLAKGRFKDEIQTTGWGHLTVKLNAAFNANNDVKMYSAGYIEGILTHIRMSQHYANHHKMLLISEKANHSLLQVKNKLAAAVALVKANSNLEEHIMCNEPKDLYWKHMRYMLFQLWGINDGYNFAAETYGLSHRLSLVDMMLINSDHELQEMMQAYEPAALATRTAVASQHAVVFLQEKQRMLSQKMLSTQNKGFLSSSRDHNNSTSANFSTARKEVLVDELDDAHWERRLQTTGHCTGYVRFTGTDLLVGHTTWNDYSLMLRIYKYYDFPLTGAQTSLQSFSSYPGLISSGDEFYVLDSNLVVLDTTMELLNGGLRDKVNDLPNVPNFMHVMAANRLSGNAPDWVDWMKRLNTGTDSAQWMVIDYNQFTPGAALLPNTLWVMEKIPGTVEAHDMTNFLQEEKFWGSVNRPFFPAIREATGFTGAEKTNGALYSAMDNPRMTILKGAAPGALGDMRLLMQENLWGTWPGPTGAGHDISARMDLMRMGPVPNGGIDSKLVNRCLVKTQSVQAISGPTKDTQPAFSWINDATGDERFPAFPHIGMPDKWDFSWVQMTSTGPGVLNDGAACD